MVNQTTKLTLKRFILNRVKNKEDLRPVAIIEAWAVLFPKNLKSKQSVSQMLKRMNLTSEKREEMIVEKAREDAVKDILDYQEVKNYLASSDVHSTTQGQVKRILKYIRFVWELMGKSDPHTWNQESVIEALKTKYPMKVNEQGAKVFTCPSAVQLHLSSVNTLFQGILSKKFSMGFNREKGALVDHFTFSEWDAFVRSASAEKYAVAFVCQLNMGSREGTNGNTGVIGLRWEDINFQTRRCKLREKGGHGHAGRIWQNVPLDFFKWLNGWDLLLNYWEHQGQPQFGKVFDYRYAEYLKAFHEARKAAGGRIATEKETFTPHIIRKTAAQWKKKLRYPLEIIAGKFPNGIMGVGWDNLNILKDFYTEIEPDEYDEANAKAETRIKALGLT